MGPQVAHGASLVPHDQIPMAMKLRWGNTAYLGVWRVLLLLCPVIGPTSIIGQAPIERLRGALRDGDHQALRSTAEALLRTTELPQEVHYEAEWHLAFANSLMDDPIGAIDHAQNALLIARAMPDTSRMLASLYQLTKFNVEGKHYEEADALRKQHLALAGAYGKDRKQLALAHNSVGSMYSRSDRLDSAEHHYRQALRYTDPADAVVRQAVLGNLASTLAERGAYTDAIRVHEQVLQELDSTDLTNRAWALRTFAQTLIFARHYPRAIAVMDESDSLNKASGNALDLAIDLAELRADCLDSLGDAQGAYRMIKLARNLQDTLFERSLSEQVSELQARFDTRLKQEEIERLDAENKQKAESLRARSMQLYGSLALALLALSAALLVWRNLRQKRKYSASLELLNAELSEQKTRIEDINRLLQLKVLRTQMNPHFIYNSLNAIHNLVRKGETAAAGAYLDGFARLLRMVLDHSVKDRIPLEDEIAFLRQYLELESVRFEDGLDFTVDADRALLDDDPIVPALLVQPFVENAVWHGLAPKHGPKRLHVHFHQRDGKLACTVEDNGVGREAAPKRSHPDGSTSLGLQLTNERLQLLTYKLEGSGRITFTDLKHGEDAAGTRVEVVLGDS